MYVDSVKTLITASGIAVALLASAAKSAAARATVTLNDQIVTFSAKVAVVCLVLCIVLSLVVTFALVRSFDRAQSRYGDEQRRVGQASDGTEGKLTLAELAFILVPAAPALSLFVVGFAFLARIAYHF